VNSANAKNPVTAKKRQPGPPTVKDGALASDVIHARAMLINMPATRGALDDVVAGRVEARQLAARTFGLFTVAYVDYLAAHWNEISPRLDDCEDWALVYAGVGLSCGRFSQGPHHVDPGTIDIAVRAIAYQVGGLRPAEADRRVAAELNPGLPMKYRTEPATVRAYRKRIRDRARALDDDGPSEFRPVEGAAATLRAKIAIREARGRRIQDSLSQALADARAVLAREPLAP
jgi:hypothetical protein